MKTFSLIIMLFVSSTAYGQDAHFLQNFGDVPVMEGLTEMETSRIVFDAPGGTIATAILSGTMKKKDARAFYDASLTALGWAKLDSKTKYQLVYERGAERLTVSMEQRKKQLKLIFNLVPVSD